MADYGVKLWQLVLEFAVIVGALALGSVGLVSFVRDLLSLRKVR